MRLELIFHGKTRESYLQAGIDDFSKRLGHYVKTDLKIIKEKGRGGSGTQAKKQEGEHLLSSCSKSSYLVALDPSGRQLTSEELAELIDNWENQSRQVVSFLIGGPEGLDQALLKKADIILSLSKMTFTHEMARLLLLEQLYRAYTINAGTKYHK